MILFHLFIFNSQPHAYRSITRIHTSSFRALSQHTCIVPKIRNVVENNPRPDRISSRYLKCPMMLIMKRVTRKRKSIATGIFRSISYSGSKDSRFDSLCSYRVLDESFLPDFLIDIYLLSSSCLEIICSKAVF